MARTYKNKGIHAKPENAGAKNLVGAKVEPDEYGIMGDLINIYHEGRKHSNMYRGQWTPEQLSEAISNFFDYCAEHKLKATKPMLTLWLGVDKVTMNRWEQEAERFGEISVLVKEALLILESYLQYDINKYPTGNIFLLKTSYGHVECSKVDVTTNGESIGNADELDSLIKKLGLDEK